MSDKWQPINNGRQQSSYKEFTVELPAQGIYTLNNPFNYFRCLEASHAFKIAWSTNQMNTDFEVGLGIKFEDVIPYVQIFNDSDSPLTARVGMGIGYFDDSRLTVSGTVQTAPAQFANFSAETMTFDETGMLEIAPAQKVLIQNTGSTIMYIGGEGTDGLQLQPQGTFETSLQDSLTLYGTSGSTVAVGSFS